MISLFLIISLIIGYGTLLGDACTASANLPLSLGERSPETVELPVGSPKLNSNEAKKKFSHPDNKNRVCRPIDSESPTGPGSDPNDEIGHDPRAGAGIKSSFPDEITHDREPVAKAGSRLVSDKKSGPNGGERPGSRGDFGDGIGDPMMKICPPGYEPVDRPNKAPAAAKPEKTEAPTTRQQKITTESSPEPTEAAFVTEVHEVRTTVGVRTTRRKRPKTTTPSDVDSDVTQRPDGGAGAGGGDLGVFGGSGHVVVPPISKVPAAGPVNALGGAGSLVVPNPPSAGFPGFQPPGFSPFGSFPPSGPAVLPFNKVPNPRPASKQLVGGTLVGAQPQPAAGGYGGGGYGGGDGGYGNAGADGSYLGSPSVPGQQYGPAVPAPVPAPGPAYGGNSYGGQTGPLPAPGPAPYGGGDGGSYGSPVNAPCGGTSGPSGCVPSGPSGPSYGGTDGGSYGSPVSPPCGSTPGASPCAPNVPSGPAPAPYGGTDGGAYGSPNIPPCGGGGSNCGGQSGGGTYGGYRH